MKQKTLKNQKNEAVETQVAGTGQKTGERPGEHRNEFEENNRREKENMEEERENMLASSQEVIDVIMKVSEAAGIAAAHMEGRTCEGESFGETVLKNADHKSMHNFLNVLSMVGAEKLEKKKRKERQKSPYEDFVQVNNKMMDCLISLADVDPQALRILLFIIQNMDGYNALVCSYAVLQERFGMSHTTVWRHVKYLKDHGYIHVTKTGSSNVYILSPELAWRSWGSNVKYCEFPANVIISSSEQDKDYKIKRKRGVVGLKNEPQKKKNKEGEEKAQETAGETSGQDNEGDT